MPVSNPAAIHLADFFRHVTAGGPTAASAVYHVFRWYNRNLGASFPLEHFQPWGLLNILAITQELTGTAQVIGLFILMAAVSCIRFRHMQRSHVVALHEEPRRWLEMCCAKGKSRVRFQPPSNWAVPDLFSLVKCLMQVFSKHHPHDATFLWPALGLKASDFWQLRETAHLLLARKMPGKQFLELFRGFLCRALVDPSPAACAGYNRLRRCMPSGAHASGRLPSSLGRS